MGDAALAWREAEAPYGIDDSDTPRPLAPGRVRLEGGRGGSGEPSDETLVAAGPDDPDALEDLGDEIATLAAHIHAATHRFLTLIARFDRLEGWERGGHRSCAHWLAFRTGLDLGTAREHVRVARALVRLPATSAAMARGGLSFSQVRALSRVAEAGSEAQLLELAEGTTTAQLERVVRAWKRGSRGEEAARERQRHRARAFSVFPDEEGAYVVKGRLDPEVGALLMRAVEAASDALYREKRIPGLADDPERAAARRRADAVGLLAERALAAGFGGAGREWGSERESASRRESEPEPGDGNGCSCGSESTSEPPPSEPPISGTRAERYQVVLHVEPATLAVPGEGEGEPGRSELEDGTRVSAETSRRLACDAGTVSVTHAPDGSILSVGRRTRTIPPALRRALEVRDRGCRFPGCGLRFTDAHHLIHWAEGGETSLANTLLLCRYHHRLVHEDGWQVEWWGTGQAAFRDPRGQVHIDGGWREAGRRRARHRPQEPPPREPVAALVRQNRIRGVQPDPYTASARWKRERDIPDHVLFRATEAAL